MTREGEPMAVETNRLRPEDRYQRDVAFRTVVDVMRSMIREREMTPTEIREAAMLACILEDRENPRRRTILWRPDGSMEFLEPEDGHPAPVPCREQFPDPRRHRDL